jgi:hypothetical protein
MRNFTTLETKGGFRRVIIRGHHGVCRQSLELERLSRGIVTAPSHVTCYRIHLGTPTKQLNNRNVVVEAFSLTALTTRNLHTWVLRVKPTSASNKMVYTVNPPKSYDYFSVFGSAAYPGTQLVH